MVYDKVFARGEGCYYSKYMWREFVPVRKQWLSDYLPSLSLRDIEDSDSVFFLCRRWIETENSVNGNLGSVVSHTFRSVNFYGVYPLGRLSGTTPQSTSVINDGVYSHFFWTPTDIWIIDRLTLKYSQRLVFKRSWLIPLFMTIKWGSSSTGQYVDIEYSCLEKFKYLNLWKLPKVGKH